VAVACRAGAFAPNYSDRVFTPQSADIVLLLADGSRRELRVRCVVRPDREQALLLQRLGLALPERLRPPVGTPKVVAT
jgi:hypothetical protein